MIFQHLQHSKELQIKKTFNKIDFLKKLSRIVTQNGDKRVSGKTFDLRYLHINYKIKLQK